MHPDRPQTTPGDGAHGEWTLLAELAPLGVLDPEAHRRLGDHVQEGCGRCAQTLDRAWAAIDVLALATPVLEATSRARADLLAAVGKPARVVPLRGRGRAGAGWLVAAGLAAAATGLGVAQERALDRARAQRTEIADALAAERAARATAVADLSSLEEHRADLARRNALLENAVDVLGGAELRTVLLSGDSPFADARVRVLFDPELERTVLLARELPPPPPGRTYQLWLVEEGAPSSLGVFRPDEQGRALELERGLLDRVGDRFFAVSVEPEGGVPQPTGPIVLTGS